MNVPNKLTVSRLVITVVFLAVLFIEFPFHQTLALALFIAASITDHYDGKIARRDKLITNFGILMDPLADKILTCSAFIAFVGTGDITAWMVVIIVARELAITGLRMLAASQNLVLAAERLGKHKTTIQIIAIIAVLVRMSCGDWAGFGKLFLFEIAGRPWVDWFTILSIWLAVILTFWSGAQYLWRNRDVYLKDL
jgi:CDP-diacylglycerol--glycerol-3-phosphate 3-phosphatidyltransferase